MCHGRGLLVLSVDTTPGTPICHKQGAAAGVRQLLRALRGRAGRREQQLGYISVCVCVAEDLGVGYLASVICARAQALSGSLVMSVTVYIPEHDSQTAARACAGVRGCPAAIICWGTEDAPSSPSHPAPRHHTCHIVPCIADVSSPTPQQWQHPSGSALGAPAGEAAA